MGTRTTLIPYDRIAAQLKRTASDTDRAFAVAVNETFAGRAAGTPYGNCASLPSQIRVVRRQRIRWQAGI